MYSQQIKINNKKLSFNKIINIFILFFIVIFLYLYFIDELSSIISLTSSLIYSCLPLFIYIIFNLTGKRVKRSVLITDINKISTSINFIPPTGCRDFNWGMSFFDISDRAINIIEMNDLHICNIDNDDLNYFGVIVNSISYYFKLNKFCGFQISLSHLIFFKLYNQLVINYGEPIVDVLNFKEWFFPNLEMILTNNYHIINNNSIIANSFYYIK
jgi:hypothetical protein